MSQMFISEVSESLRRLVDPLLNQDEELLLRIQGELQTPGVGVALVLVAAWRYQGSRSGLCRSITGMSQAHSDTQALELEVSRCAQRIYAAVQLALEEMLEDPGLERSDHEGRLWADHLVFQVLSDQYHKRIIDLSRRESFEADVEHLWGQRRAAYQKMGELPELFDWWMSLSPMVQVPAFEAMARIIWTHVVAPEQALARSREIALEEPGAAQVRGVRVNQTTYTLTPRLTGSLGWSFAAVGQEILEVQGDRYAGAPMLARYIARSLVDAPRHAHQIALQFEREPKEVFLDVGGLRYTRQVLTLQEAKTLLFLTTTAPGDDSAVSMSLQELTAHLNPSQKRIQRRDHVQIAQALETLSRAHVVLPDDTVVPLFAIRRPRDPETAKPEQPISWSLTLPFRQLSQGGLGSYGDERLLRKLNGAFLLNLSAVLSFKQQDHSLFRHYICACSMFNDVRLNDASGAQAPLLTVDDWANVTNTWSAGALSGNRRKVSQDRSMVRRALEELAGRGLVRFEIEGSRRANFSFRLGPSDDHVIAYEQMRERPGFLQVF